MHIIRVECTKCTEGAISVKCRALHCRSISIQSLILWYKHELTINSLLLNAQLIRSILVFRSCLVCVCGFVPLILCSLMNLREIKCIFGAVDIIIPVTHFGAYNSLRLYFCNLGGSSRTEETRALLFTEHLFMLKPFLSLFFRSTDKFNRLSMHLFSSLKEWRFRSDMDIKCCIPIIKIILS